MPKLRLLAVCCITVHPNEFFPMEPRMLQLWKDANFAVNEETGCLLFRPSIINSFDPIGHGWEIRQEVAV